MQKNNSLNRFIAVLVMISMIAGLTVSGTTISKADESYLLSLNRPCYASTVNGNDIPTRATDGDIYTHWGAQWEIDNQWIDVDLGAVATIDRVVLKWQNEMTYATRYRIEVSNDEINWQTIYVQNNGTGGQRVQSPAGNIYCQEEISLSGQGRYMRMFAEKCVSGFGVALYEFEVYGTGGINPPPKPTVNLALNKPVTASSTDTPWWAQPGDLDPVKAVDGNKSTYWLSQQGNDQWFQVDLGSVYTIGQVNIIWGFAEFGRVYDIQVSNDGQNWTTIYRELNGMGDPDYIPVYATARYVRMKGYAMARGSGYSISEFEVLQYVPGDPQPTYQIPPLPTSSTVQVGKGSYLINDFTMAHPRYPKYVTGNVSVPIPSNDWWTSIIYKRLSDGVVALPLLYQYHDTGLGFFYASPIFTAPNNGGMDTKFGNMDLFINTSSILRTPEARVDGFGDWSVDVVFSDDVTPKMRNTIIKGSPYVYSTFTDPNSVEISSPALVGIFNDSGTPILVNDGDSITTDHIGVEVKNTNTAPVSQTYNRSYGIFAPPGTVFTRVGSKIKIRLGSGQNYLSVGLLPQKSDLNYMYQHAYAFVTDTNVSYSFNESTSIISTTYTSTISQKRAGMPSTTLMALFPTQWKYTTASFAPIEYRSARGLMKVIEGNSFTIQDRFYGITPSFAEPVESGSYSRAQMIEYLNTFKASVTNDYWVADPYWQGKKTHPLAMGILIAQQLEDYETRDEFISILRKILINWLTYEGKTEEYPYYLYYSDSWGTINGDGGDHGMGINMSDHHFLWAYYIFPAAVLATYDSDFVRDYGEMLEHMIRDTMNPSKTDPLYPFMRNFDVYEGHSWAGGYGDNQSGNNQESSSEATFAWAGLYLWGLVTGNKTYRDAGIWGFTHEVNAIEQYWFDYDEDNWASDYEPGVVGMVWGNAYTYGTYFSGNPSCIYGIQWLPVTPALTYLGERPDVAARIWQAYRRDQDAYQAKLASEGRPDADPEGWFHILWPYQSLSDPQSAAYWWDASKTPDDERFNSYWFIHNMNAKGLRTTDIWSTNWTSYQVFKKGYQYNAVIWNPTDSTIFVQFRNAAGNTGSAYVPPKCTISVNPMINNGMPNIPLPPAPAPDPAPIQVPGLIEAEDYYTNFSCHKVDSPEGKAVGFIDPGDRLIYHINVLEEGDYTLHLRVINGSSETAEVQFKSDLSGSTVLSTVSIPSTGSWNTVTSSIHLKKGVQKLTLYVKSGHFDINWIQIGEGSGPSEPGTNIALGKPANTSSYVGGNSAANAFDGNVNTRWESDFSDPQWISVDLGATYSITGVKLQWETAAGKDYKIQISTDNVNWIDAYTKTNGSGGTEVITFAPVAGRYVRMYGTQRTTGWGYSLWEFEVYGEIDEQPVTGDNIALGKTADTSSFIGGNTAANAFDGNANTRWESEYSDPQWISVDLGGNYTITGVKLQWETAAGRDYKIQVSTDNINWIDAYTKTNGSGGTEIITFTPVTGRYVRLYGTQRTTGYGYSLWEFEVYGQSEGQPQTSNLALNRPVTASSVQSGLPETYAVDGDNGTRWGSDWSDPQWIYVDLGAVKTVNRVKLNWEAAYGKSYKIQVSLDANNWTDVYSTTTGDGGIDDIVFSPTSARYVRMYGTERGTPYGYSLWEFEVYGQ